LPPLSTSVLLPYLRHVCSLTRIANICHFDSHSRQRSVPYYHQIFLLTLLLCALLLSSLARLPSFLCTISYSPSAQESTSSECPHLFVLFFQKHPGDASTAFLISRSPLRSTKTSGALITYILSYAPDDNRFLPLVLGGALLPLRKLYEHSRFYRNISFRQTPHNSLLSPLVNFHLVQGHC